MTALWFPCCSWTPLVSVSLWREKCDMSWLVVQSQPSSDCWQMSLRSAFNGLLFAVGDRSSSHNQHQTSSGFGSGDVRQSRFLSFASCQKYKAQAHPNLAPASKRGGGGGLWAHSAPWLIWNCVLAACDQCWGSGLWPVGPEHLWQSGL